MKQTFTNDQIRRTTLEELRNDVLWEVCSANRITTNTNRHSMIDAILRHPERLDITISFEKAEDPWPEFRLLEGDLPGDHAKTRCFVKLSEYILLGLGYRRSTAMEINLLTQKVRPVEFSRHGFIGSATLKNGGQIAFPADTPGFSLYDEVRGWIHDIGNTNYQTRGGAQTASGEVICPKWTREHEAVGFDPLSFRSRMIPYNPPNGKASLGSQAHWGAVGNGEDVWLLPWDAEFVGFFKNGSNEVTQIGERIQGGKEFSHGVYDPQSKLILSIGRELRGILVIDTMNQTSHIVPFSQELSERLGSATPSFDIIIGPDDWIYPIPYGHPTQIRIHRQSLKIEWRDISGFCEEHGLTHYGGNGIFTVAHREGNRIYLGSGRSNKAAYMEFQT